MTSRLNAMFDMLDLHDERVPLYELTREMKAMNITIDDVTPYIHFEPDGYSRNLIRRGPGYEALLLCWSPGQRSPIHDHVGSSCGLIVLKGEAVEQVYEHDGKDHLVPTVVHRYKPGKVCGTQDADIHEIINDSDDDLITLHIYTPPLGAINIYDPHTGRATSTHSPVHLGGSPRL